MHVVNLHQLSFTFEVLNYYQLAIVYSYDCFAVLFIILLLLGPTIHERYKLLLYVKRLKVKGLDIYIPPLTGKPWPAAGYN